MSGAPSPGRILGIALAALFFLVADVAACFAGSGCADGGSPVPLEQHHDPGDEGGIGGTGIDPEGGIGGTGISRAPGDEGGVGGTGIDPEDATAVVGIVTGFASICVGETEIHYSADTPVLMNGGEASADRLAVGQVVEVVAGGSGAELVAARISVDHMLSGPVTGIDRDDGSIEVMGQRVLLTELAVPVDETIVEGSWVEVSGLWRGDGVVVASRVDEAAGRDRARVVGRFGRTDAGRDHIGGVRVDVGNALRVDTVGDVVAVGRWADGMLVADRVEMSPRSALPRLARRAQIEGYIGAIEKAERLEVGGWAIEVPEAERAEWAKMPVDRRIQLNGVVDRNGRLVPERVRFPRTGHRRPPFEPHGAKPPSDIDGSGPPPDVQAGFADPGRAQGKPPPGPPMGGQPPDAQHVPPPRPRAHRPPVPDRPQRPEVPRAQRPPPPPRGGRPPPPPKPPPPPRPPR